MQLTRSMIEIVSLMGCRSCDVTIEQAPGLAASLLENKRTTLLLLYLVDTFDKSFSHTHITTLNLVFRSTHQQTPFIHTSQITMSTPQDKGREADIKARESADKAKESARLAKEAAADRVEQGKEKAEEVYEEGKEKAVELKNQFVQKLKEDGV